MGSYTRYLASKTSKKKGGKRAKRENALMMTQNRIAKASERNINEGNEVEVEQPGEPVVVQGPDLVQIQVVADIQMPPAQCDFSGFLAPAAQLPDSPAQPPDSPEQPSDSVIHVNEGEVGQPCETSVVQGPGLVQIQVVAEIHMPPAQRDFSGFLAPAAQPPDFPALPPDFPAQPPDSERIINEDEVERPDVGDIQMPQDQPPDSPVHEPIPLLTSTPRHSPRKGASKRPLRSPKKIRREARKTYFRQLWKDVLNSRESEEDVDDPDAITATPNVTNKKTAGFSRFPVGISVDFIVVNSVVFPVIISVVFPLKVMPYPSAEETHWLNYKKQQQDLGQHPQNGILDPPRPLKTPIPLLHQKKGILIL